MAFRTEAEKWFYLISIAAILSGCVWLSAVSSVTATANSKDIEDLKAQSKQDSKEFEEIRVHLAHIEDAVGAKR